MQTMQMSTLKNLMNLRNSISVLIHDKPNKVWCYYIIRHVTEKRRHLLEYVRFPCYELAYRNGDEKRGGGVGIYIRDTIEFKVRSDILKLNDSIEHLRVEIQGRKKTFLVLWACLTNKF